MMELECMWTSDFSSEVFVYCFIFYYLTIFIILGCILVYLQQWVLLKVELKITTCLTTSTSSSAVTTFISWIRLCCSSLEISLKVVNLKSLTFENNELNN